MKLRKDEVLKPRSLTSVVVFHQDPPKEWQRGPFFDKLLQTVRLQQQTKCIEMIKKHVASTRLSTKDHPVSMSV